MKRFRGMMPSAEIKDTKTYRLGTQDWDKARVEAGPNGWTITYADASTRYKDVVATTEENMAAAVAILLQYNASAVEIPNDARQERMSEC